MNSILKKIENSFIRFVSFRVCPLFGSVAGYYYFAQKKNKYDRKKIKRTVSRSLNKESWKTERIEINAHIPKKKNKPISCVKWMQILWARLFIRGVFFIISFSRRFPVFIIAQTVFSLSCVLKLCLDFPFFQCPKSFQSSI